MALSKIFEILFPILCTIAVGYLFGKFKKIRLKPIIDLTLYITVPSLILSAILKSPLSIGDFAVLPASAIFVIATVGVSTFLLTKLFKIKQTPGLYMGSMFINSGIIPFSLALSLFGVEGLAKAIVFDATNAILIFTLGIYILVGKKNILQIFKLPVLYAIVGALLLNWTRVPIPESAVSTLSLIGQPTIPIMLLVLGYQLNHIRPNVIGLSALAGSLRVGLGLLLSLLFVNALGITGLTRSIIIISSSMPTAMNSLVLTEEYDTDADLVASTLIISTILMFISIPLILRYLI
jgi:predicted permease